MLMNCDTDSSTLVAVLQHQLSIVDEAVQSIMAMQTTWRSSLTVVTLHGTVPARLCLRSASIHWFHTSITVITGCSVQVKMSWYDRLASQRPATLPCLNSFTLHLFLSTLH